jgi:curved DNA-binding protein CbpA
MARHNDRVDPYAVLGVRPGSSEQEVAAAYKELAKKWHPDRGAGQEGERRMMEINVAYDALRAADLHGDAGPEARVAGSPRPGVPDIPPEPGSWLPDRARRALGRELLSSLTPDEAVHVVTPTSLSASPRAILAVTDRRLIWLLDDAPVARVRSLPLRDVASVEPRARRRRSSLTVRTLAGRRHVFHDLLPQTAATIAQHVRPA